jgi:hypothetical protein
MNNLETFTEEDMKMTDKLASWVEESVKRIGPDKTRWILETILNFDFTKLPK